MQFFANVATIIPLTLSSLKLLSANALRTFETSLNEPIPLFRVNKVAKGYKIISYSYNGLPWDIENDLVKEAIFVQGTSIIEEPIINNEKYNEANNISSAYLVRDLFENSYVLESDLILYNEKLIRKYEYQSNFLAMYTDMTDDWCFETKNGVITKQKIGGYDCHQMIGISFYDEKDGRELCKDIDEVYNSPGGKEKYWDQIPLEVCKNNYKIYIRECQKEDIVEIDTFNELKILNKYLIEIFDYQNKDTSNKG